MSQASDAALQGRVLVAEQVYKVCLAHALMTEREEVMGLLLGHASHSEVRIWSSMTLRRSDKRPDRCEIAPEQLVEAVDAAEALSKAMDCTTRVVGWYHSHPHITCFPSHVDLRTQMQYQAMDPDFVGLIFGVFNYASRTGGAHHDLIAFRAHDDGSGGPLVQRNLTVEVVPLCQLLTKEQQKAAVRCKEFGGCIGQHAILSAVKHTLAEVQESRGPETGGQSPEESYVASRGHFRFLETFAQLSAEHIEPLESHFRDVLANLEVQRNLWSSYRQRQALEEAERAKRLEEEKSRREEQERLRREQREQEEAKRQREEQQKMLEEAKRKQAEEEKRRQEQETRRQEEEKKRKREEQEAERRRVEEQKLPDRTPEELEDSEEIESTRAKRIRRKSSIASSLKEEEEEQRSSCISLDESPEKTTARGPASTLRGESSSSSFFSSMMRAPSSGAVSSNGGAASPAAPAVTGKGGDAGVVDVDEVLEKDSVFGPLTLCQFALAEDGVCQQPLVFGKFACQKHSRLKNFHYRKQKWDTKLGSIELTQNGLLMVKPKDNHLRARPHPDGNKEGTVNMRTFSVSQYGMRIMACALEFLNGKPYSELQELQFEQDPSLQQPAERAPKAKAKPRVGRKK